MPELKRLPESVDELAEEFAQRTRVGDRPTVEEYVKRYPHWADEIRDLLPTVLLMEQLKPRRDDTTSVNTAVECPTSPPDRLGEFRIIREIGRGGMGVVYEADQESLNRRVAIKVLPGSLLVNEKLKQRFRHEAMAAAKLHHSNIVPVFAVDESNGFCFYVMQLINGRGLDEIIRDLSASRAGSKPWSSGAPTEPFPSPAGNTEIATPGSPSVVHQHPVHPAFATANSRAYCQTVARVGCQVANALNYAHQKGVLHRDIKPSNLLLDDRGDVWVTDFGVAKLVEGANLTQSGDIVGTLKYMPPEQFAGQSDVRGDVYSLGVTLYELLTLRPAFPDTTPQHLIRLITEETPLRPRILNPDIPADLETIVLKAMAREPARRYHTPGEMAADLDRFLVDRPIIARRTGPMGLLMRFCRRNPALAVATAAPFVLICIMAGVAAVAYLQTPGVHDSTTANQALAKALVDQKSETKAAERMADEALAGLNRTYQRFAPGRLVVVPIEQRVDDDAVMQPPVLAPEAIPVLEELLHPYEQLALDASRYPALRSQAGEAYQRIGDLQQRLGRLVRAEAAYRKAIDLYTQVLTAADGSDIRVKQARACVELGATLETLLLADKAREQRQRALKIMTSLPREYATLPECRFELARAHYALSRPEPSLPIHVRAAGSVKSEPARPKGNGETVPDEPRSPRAVPEFVENPNQPKEPGSQPLQQAVKALQALVDEYPSVPEYAHLLACFYCTTRNTRDDGAALLRELVSRYPNVPDYRYDLCRALADKAVEGNEPFDEVLRLSAELVAQHPNIPEYAAAYALYLDASGTKLFESGKFEESEKLLRKAVETQNNLVARRLDVKLYQLSLGVIERSLGRTLIERQALREAIQRFNSAAERVETVTKSGAHIKGDRAFLRLTYRDLARVLKLAGDEVQANQALHKSEGFGTDAEPDDFEP